MQLLAFAATSLAVIGTVGATDCTEAQAQTLASNSHVGQCTKDAGFAIISKLTADHIKKICGSSACMALWGDVKTLDFGDCTFRGLGISLQTDVLDPVYAVCGGSASGSSDAEVGSDKASLRSSSSTTSVSMAVVFSVLALMLSL
ncbi:hypothetical protein PF005_g1672 [Phytophthora fragariae]|uniref:Elicitin n=1 Tax=Phytophthora fragariae TaxID=53985 RepID=A0A6A3ZER2_9STRA|nr:hypothetical protein PF003_g35131 [Phytophthora fragariae]KAE8948726.1 hypothetical protein PF009_g1726 [Phytophthora fragariae]KAE9105907.1 hypothetical protein PF007_g13601 [Phytophthora fragariae]KAE9138364.1 hypothetical protein PF010_g1003 [Phytophthora fragariae]KAE9154615.1 hypothetical protein PF006_g1343 [Phytophthora fragariae]